jgi:hypothetical protein
MNNNDEATLRPKGALKWMVQIFQVWLLKIKMHKMDFGPNEKCQDEDYTFSSTIGWID